MEGNTRKQFEKQNFDYKKKFEELQQSKFCLGTKINLEERFDMSNKIFRDQGSNGIVYEAKQIKDGRSYALKQTPKDGQDFGNVSEEIEKELLFMQKLYHDGLDEFPPRYLIRSSGYYVCYTEENGKENIYLYIVQILLECSVLEIIKKNEKVSEEEIIYFLIQIINAMWHMKYIYRIQHRDLKPGNILRYKKNWYGITDWGSSRLRVDSRNTLRGASMDSFQLNRQESNQFKGTEIYAAPEQLKSMYSYDQINDKEQKEKLKSQEKQDVFSAGISAFQLLYPEINIEIINNQNSDGSQLANEIQKIKNPLLSKLISHMTQWDHSKRFHIDECVSFINNNFQEEIEKVQQIMEIQEFRDNCSQLELLQKQFFVKEKLEQGWKFHKKKEFELAYWEATSSFEIVALFFSEQDELYLKTLHLLGDVLLKQGFYDHSLAIAEKAFGISQINREDEDEINLDLQYLISMIKFSKGEYKKSQEILQIILPFRIQVSGQNAIETGFIYNLMGANQERFNQYNEAISNFKKYSQISEKFYGQQSEEYATSLNNIGLAYNNKGDLYKAKEYFQKSLEFKRKIFKNQNNNSLASTLANLGSLERHLGQFEEAEKHLQESLKIRIDLYGKDHLETSYAQNNLGFLYLKLKDYEKAKPLLHQAYSTRKRDFPDKHEGTILAEQHLDKCKKLMELNNQNQNKEQFNQQKKKKNDCQIF